MILVTIGTQDKPFTRLLEAVQECIDNKEIKDKVVVQAGHTSFESNDMDIFDLLPKEKYESVVKECTLMIVHGGVSSILDGLSNNIPVIAAARLQKYNEHINDHQIQIIKKFAKEGYILELEDFSKLGELIEKSKTFKAKKYNSTTQNVINLIEDFIDNN